MLTINTAFGIDTNYIVLFDHESIYAAVRDMMAVDLKSSHVNRLEKMCRVCGERNRKFRSRTSQVRKVTNYDKQLCEIFNTDVVMDDPEIHPPNFCNRCYQTLSRRTKVRSIEWKSHSQECKVCNDVQSKARRPSKSQQMCAARQCKTEQSICTDL